MAVPPEFIEDLRHRVPLSEIIGKRVKLVRKGRRFSGLCPFHSEKTPSFSVVDDDGYYHCFGCGVHGDAISFLREMDGLEFMEAVERLADMAGMAMPLGAPQDPKVTQQRKAALDILETTATFFRAALDREDGKDAARYLLNRNLDTNILQTYRLGYAPRGGLRAALSAKGFSDADMLAAGVLRKSDRDGSLYDYFRDRVMFPIENRQGKVIAFGARALGDAQPKYLNSGEGPTFSKKAVLYGWVQAREGLRRHLPLVIAEGYMDVIAIHKSGVAAAVQAGEAGHGGERRRQRHEAVVAAARVADVQRLQRGRQRLGQRRHVRRDHVKVGLELLLRVGAPGDADRAHARRAGRLAVRRAVAHVDRVRRLHAETLATFEQAVGVWLRARHL